MDTIKITTSVATREWVSIDAGWRDVTAQLEHTIPAPAPGDRTAPDQFAVGDRVEVHAMGTWYPAVVTAAPNGRDGSTFLVARYSSGTGAQRNKRVRREHLVPAGCGYRAGRTDGVRAEAWAAAVWRAIAEHAANALVTVQAATPAPPGEPLPPMVIAPARLVTGQQVRDTVSPKAYRGRGKRRNTEEG